MVETVSYRRGPEPLRRTDEPAQRRRAFVKKVTPELWPGRNDVIPVALECQVAYFPTWASEAVLNVMDDTLQSILWGQAYEVFTGRGVLDHPWMFGPEEPWALVTEPYHEGKDQDAIKKDIEALGLKLRIFPPDESPYAPGFSHTFVAYLDVSQRTSAGLGFMAAGLRKLLKRVEQA